jgi:hypothetical protein
MIIAKPVDERLLYSKSWYCEKPSSKKAKEIKQNSEKRKKCIDLGYLDSRTKSNSLMMEMIAFTANRPLVTAIQESLNKDWELLRASAHKMVPSFP